VGARVTDASWSVKTGVAGSPRGSRRADQVRVRETVGERALSMPAELKEVIEKNQVAGDRLSRTQLVVPALPITTS
jgi:hypothetical protein